MAVLRRPTTPTDIPLADVRAGIERHLREIVAWSARVQWYGWPSDTDDASIALRFSVPVRRYRAGAESTTYDNDAILLHGRGNYVLLGVPWRW